MRAWYERAFGEFYLQLYAHRDEGEAQRVLRLLFPGNELRGRRVLDLACGAGRYLPEIERAGGRALGMDLSAPLLREAAARSPHLPLVRADMRRLPLPDRGVDWILSLFTSFGYFEDLEAHRALATEWLRVAEEGIALDLPNPHHLRRHLVPESRRERGELHIEERRRLQPDPLRVVKEVRVRRPSGEGLFEYEERVMLFDREQLEQLFAREGMHCVRCFGDYDGSQLDPGSSPRQLLLFAREGRRG